MKKLFVVADVHSFYEKMIKALSEQGFDRDDPDHVFVSLGDLFDRGLSPLKCLNFVNSLPAERKILIRGNHEDLLEECLAREAFFAHDIHNGTMDTIKDPSVQVVQHTEGLFYCLQNYLFSFYAFLCCR